MWIELLENWMPAQNSMGSLWLPPTPTPNRCACGKYQCTLPYPASAKKFEFSNCYLNVLLRLIISCIKGIFNFSLKTKSALKASINMMTTLSNFGGKGCLVPSRDGSGGKFSLVALPWIAFFSGKKPRKNSIKPTIWQNKSRTIKAPWPQGGILILARWMNENVSRLKAINKAVNP